MSNFILWNLVIPMDKHTNDSWQTAWHRLHSVSHNTTATRNYRLSHPRQKMWNVRFMSRTFPLLNKIPIGMSPSRRTSGRCERQRRVSTVSAKILRFAIKELLSLRAAVLAFGRQSNLLLRGDCVATAPRRRFGPRKHAEQERPRNDMTTCSSCFEQRLFSLWGYSQ